MSKQTDKLNKEFNNFIKTGEISSYLEENMRKIFYSLKIDYKDKFFNDDIYQNAILKLLTKRHLIKNISPVNFLKTVFLRELSRVQKKENRYIPLRPEHFVTD